MPFGSQVSSIVAGRPSSRAAPEWSVLAHRPAGHAATAELLPLRRHDNPVLRRSCSRSHSLAEAGHRQLVCVGARRSGQFVIISGPNPNAGFGTPRVRAITSRSREASMNSHGLRVIAIVALASSPIVVEGRPIFAQGRAFAAAGAALRRYRLGAGRPSAGGADRPATGEGLRGDPRAGRRSLRFWEGGDQAGRREDPGRERRVAARASGVPRPDRGALR